MELVSTLAFVVLLAIMIPAIIIASALGSRRAEAEAKKAAAEERQATLEVLQKLSAGGTERVVVDCRDGGGRLTAEVNRLPKCPVIPEEVYDCEIDSSQGTRYHLRRYVPADRQPAVQPSAAAGGHTPGIGYTPSPLSPGYASPPPDQRGGGGGRGRGGRGPGGGTPPAGPSSAPTGMRPVV